MIRLQRFFRFLVVSLALSTGTPGIAQAEPMNVFVSLLPQKYFAERVGGDRVRVSVMVGPGQSPATYEPTPKQMAKLSVADLYWRMGSPFEDVWMGHISVTNPSMRIVDARTGITLRPMESVQAVLSGGTDMQPQKQRHDHVGRRDPHIWLSPRLVKYMSARFRDTLIEIDPQHRALYEANYQGLAEELDQLDRDIEAMLTGAITRRFMVFHPAWGYFAEAYGLHQIPIEIEGKVPGAKTLAALITLARREGIRVIFVQRQFSRRDAETVARAIDGKVVAVDPLAEDYSHNLREVAQAFAEALQ